MSLQPHVSFAAKGRRFKRRQGKVLGQRQALKLQSDSGISRETDDMGEWNGFISDDTLVGN